MFSKLISIFVGISLLTTNTVMASGPVVKTQDVHVLSQKTYSLTDRYTNSYVNNVFSDNILLTLGYMRGIAKEGQPVDWKDVRGNFNYVLLLKPGETFAFHDIVLPKYQHTQIIATDAHFNSTQGFESDGYLYGDGVCHLASFMNVVAKGAHLEVVAPTPHDFAKIADVSRNDGVAIYYNPEDPTGSSKQNLYITNSFVKPIVFVFAHHNNSLTITVEKIG